MGYLINIYFFFKYALIVNLMPVKRFGTERIKRGKLLEAPETHLYHCTGNRVDWKQVIVSI